MHLCVCVCCHDQLSLGTLILRVPLREGQVTPQSVLVGLARLTHFPPAISLPQTSGNERTRLHIIFVAEGRVQ